MAAKATIQRLVRIPPELNRSLVKAAKEARQSANAYVLSAIAERIKSQS